MPGNINSGRKTKPEELAISEFYKKALPRTFKILDKYLNSEIKSDQKWAVEQLSKGFVKMLPTMLAGDSDNRIPIPIYPIYGGKSAATLNT